MSKTLRKRDDTAETKRRSRRFDHAKPLETLCGPAEDTTDVIYAEDEDVFRETAVSELLKVGFLRLGG